MNTAANKMQLFVFFGIISILSFAHATTYYVDASQLDDVGDGLSWQNAKQTVQAAVNLSADGDTVLVTNGVYDVGSQTSSASQAWPNRVYVDKEITLQSVNGPEVTSLDGADEMRVVYLERGVVLDGFSIINGRSSSNTNLYVQRNGAGVYASGTGSLWAEDTVITNCIISGNRSFSQGGGAYLTDAVMRDCVITNNNSWGSGGGLYLDHSSVEFSTVVDNYASFSGGGVELTGSTVSSCFIQDNSAYSVGSGCYLNGSSQVNSSLITGNSSYGVASAVEFAGGSLRFCTVTVNEDDGVGSGYTEINSCIIYGNRGTNILDTTGNIHHCCSPDLVTGVNDCVADIPNFRDGYRLNYNSPCRSAGEFCADILYDLDGNPRDLGGVDIGAYEAALSVYVDGFRQADDSGDGYTLATAKRTLQAGADVARELLDTWPHLGRVELWVDDISSGSYSEGGAPAPGGSLTNRLAVSSNIWVYAMRGQPVIEGSGKVRCVYLGENSRMEGFILQNGKTKAAGDAAGGGALLDKNAFISDCVINTNWGLMGGGVYLLEGASIADCELRQNTAGVYGGGVFMENNNTMTSCDLVYNSCGRDGGAVFAWSGSILENCKISLNEATRLGGGLYLEGSDANQCLLYSNQAEDGGGAYLLGDASLKNSTVERCEASDMGGGVYAEGSSTIAFNEISDNVAEIGAGAYLNGESYLVKSLLNHCVVFDNVANGESGAGVYLKTGGTLRNCTIVGNTGIGLNTESGGEVYNCIVWGNTQSDIHTSGKYSIRNTCARDGVQNQVNGCITINPRFDDYTYFDGMYYPYSLSKKSPCINRGDDNEVISTVDYKGVDRIRSTSSDIGAHETAYSGNYDTDLDGMLDEWEEEYFTTANRCDQSSDSDGDGFTNFEEYMVGTDPTNAVSYFEFSIGSEEGQRVRLHWTENLNELRTCRIYWAQTMTNEFECIRDGGSGGYVFNLDDEDYFSSELSPYSSGFFKVEIGFENDPRP